MWYIHLWRQNDMSRSLNTVPLMSPVWSSSSSQVSLSLQTFVHPLYIVLSMACNTLWWHLRHLCASSKEIKMLFNKTKSLTGISAKNQQILEINSSGRTYSYSSMTVECLGLTVLNDVCAEADAVRLFHMHFWKYFLCTHWKCFIRQAHENVFWLHNWFGINPCPVPRLCSEKGDIFFLHITKQL